MWISRITQILTENHVNITNHSTISSRHGPHAIRRIALQSQHACGLALINRTYGNHSAKHLHLSISTWTQRRRLRGMNQKWPRHVALRKRVSDELIIDVWTETNEHEENEEREKHEQTVILKSNWGWKTFWRTTAMRERKPPGNNWLRSHTISPRKRQTTTHSHFMHNTLRPTLQNDSTFTTTSLTKKHAFPNVSQHDMKHGSIWWTRRLPHNSTYCASVTTLDWTNTNNYWQTLCCTCHSHTEKSAQREEPKIISSRHSATKECEMNSSPTSPVTQHTGQQTSQTNQKHESKIWHRDTASGQDLCENNLHARTWAYQLFQLSTSQITQHNNSNTHEQTIWILQIAHQQQTILILTENQVKITSYNFSSVSVT